MAAYCCGLLILPTHKTTNLLSSHQGSMVSIHNPIPIRMQCIHHHQHSHSNPLPRKRQLPNGGLSPGSTICIRTKAAQFVWPLSSSHHFKRHLRMQWTNYHSTMLGRKSTNRYYTTLAKPSQTAFIVLDYLAQVPGPLLSQRRRHNLKETKGTSARLPYGTVDNNPPATSTTRILHQPDIPHNLPNDQPVNAGV